MVRAKFKVTRFETSMNTVRNPETGKYDLKQEMRTIVMHPVFSDDPNSENKKFWDASPSGELKLGTVNPAAWQAFELDKDYYLDFTPAE